MTSRQNPTRLPAPHQSNLARSGNSFERNKFRLFSPLSHRQTIAFVRTSSCHPFCRTATCPSLFGHIGAIPQHYWPPCLLPPSQSLAVATKIVHTAEKVTVPPFLYGIPSILHLVQRTAYGVLKSTRFVAKHGPNQGIAGNSWRR